MAKSGARSYFVGFYDHEGSQRTRSFPVARAARDWMGDYVSAERRGRESLRRFLLDLDAREANAAIEARTIGEVVQLYFAFNAPDTADGLATSTFRTYSWSAKRHLLGHEGASRGQRMPSAKYAVRLASEPAERFNHAAAPRALRDAMRRERVGQSARAHTWRVLSAVLSWAAQSELVPEIQTNGCLLANEKVGNRRKSVRGQQGRRSVRRRGEEIRSWALAPMAVELIRADMLARAAGARRPLIAYRDATLVSIQFGLGLRNQEVYGMRWSALDRERAHIVEVLSWNQLDEWGKTEHATGRAPKVPALLREDLAWWRERMRERGYPTRGVDFIIPGDLAGEEFGIRDPKTGACHMSGNGGLIWPHCGGLNWPHLRPTCSRLFGAHGARAGGGGRNGITYGDVRADQEGQGSGGLVDQGAGGAPWCSSPRGASGVGLAVAARQADAGRSACAEAGGLPGADRLLACERPGRAA